MPGQRSRPLDGRRLLDSRPPSQPEVPLRRIGLLVVLTALGGKRSESSLYSLKSHTASKLETP
jgi:hypothetical protein